MNTINEQILRDFIGYVDVLTDERMVEIASDHNVELSVVEDIARECQEGMDTHTEESLYNEYNGDGMAFGKWFDSYVEDEVREALYRGRIDEKS